MKKSAIIILILAGLLMAQSVFAEKLFLSKTKKSAKVAPRSHLLIDKFNTPREFDVNTRTANKLLVIMIEFNDDELIEDDPNTTGLGKFIQDPTGYPISLGSPPHDYQYYMDNLLALNLYYRAASLYNDYTGQGFDLEYDLFPKETDDGIFAAYQLDKPMAYYMPTDVESEVTIARFEEYFKDCFETADDDDEIIFSEYAHFMIIHAGSDWQHDTAGDTPSDIPSFFINIGDGKEVYVDNGDTVIRHASNVPETISQDFSIYNENEHYGYGAVNAVFAHEFGHSIGFIDLYNTRNYAPGVGYWDIMDSGGFGLSVFPVVDSLENTDYYFVEGAWPSLPGAWHRVITWEQQFINRGILKDLDDLDFDIDITIKPSSSIPSSMSEEPYFIRIPLDNSEYLIVENRQVDPDGDGGATMKSTSDKRVALYPTPYTADVNDTTLTYEYDFLLPGWESNFATADGWSIHLGGGLVVWHIDNEILYENNNFANNTVNTVHSRRAVHIIEADNIDDIGSIYSYFWRGTVYEPFTKYRPIFAEGNDHIFTGWDITNIHNQTLSSISKPALLSTDGIPSVYRLYDISSYPYSLNTERVMSFKLGSQLFAVTERIISLDSLYALSYPGDTGFFGEQDEFGFMAISEDLLTFKYKLYDASIDEWTFDNDWVIPETLRPEFPIFPIDWDNNGTEEFALADSHNIFIRSMDMNETIAFDPKLFSAPFYLKDKQLMVIPTEENLIIGDQTVPIPNAICTYNGESILAGNGNTLDFINPDTGEITETVTIPYANINYLPVNFRDTTNTANSATFIQNNLGDIYKIKDGELKQIFDLSSYTTSAPTQLAIGSIVPNLVHLVFATEDYVYAITPGGTMADGFPAYVENRTFQPSGHPIIVEFFNEKMLLIPDIQKGYVAVDKSGNYRQEFSFSWKLPDSSSIVPAIFKWSIKSSRLYFIFSDADNNIMSGHLENVDTNPIQWNGYRNGGQYSLYEGSIDYSSDDLVKLNGYVYPNPAGKTGEARLRIFNAKEEISLKIFDIAGNIVYKNSYPKEPGEFQELVWKISKISSGIYFGVIKSDGKSITIPIAIEK